MLYDNPRTTTRIILAAVVLAFGMLLDVALSAQAPAPTTAPRAAAPATKPGAAQATSHYVSNALPKQAQMYYQAVWGIDSLKIKYTESGEIIRFSYRVLDPAKATPINDKASEPFLYDPKAGVKLVVPTMEKIGQLRQSSTPIAGKSYWMAFSNSGRRVRPGDRVSVEVGQFRAINLMVE